MILQPSLLAFQWTKTSLLGLQWQPGTGIQLHQLSSEHARGLPGTLMDIVELLSPYHSPNRTNPSHQFYSSRELLC